MRRFGRWMFDGLAVLSLVLCVATVALWIRSHYVEDRWCALTGSGGGSGKDVVARSYAGWIEVGVQPQVAGIRYSLGHRTWYPIGESIVPYGHVLPGFAWSISHGGVITRGPLRGSYENPVTILFARHCSLALIFAIAPSIAFLLIRRKRSGRGPDDCKRCGYNLTGNVSGVCPECGKPIASKA